MNIGMIGIGNYGNHLVKGWFFIINSKKVDLTVDFFGVIMYILGGG